jgi:hypothetical protein
MSTQEAMAAARAKYAKSKAPVAVELPDVGTVFVRRLSVQDSEYLAGIKESSATGGLIAGLLCDEHGKRLSADEQSQWAEIFAEADWSDYLALTHAARGQQKGIDAGN